VVSPLSLPDLFNAEDAPYIKIWLLFDDYSVVAKFVMSGVSFRRVVHFARSCRASNNSTCGLCFTYILRNSVRRLILLRYRLYTFNSISMALGLIVSYV
jgi:hypothetical protein